MKEQNVQMKDSVEKQGMCHYSLITLYLEGNVIYNDHGVIILISQCQSSIVDEGRFLYLISYTIGITIISTTSMLLVE